MSHPPVHPHINSGKRFMHRLLIVDDEPIVMENLEALLTAMGYTVSGKAFSGEMAVSMAARLLPDLIIMDIVMPGKMDGIDAAQEIRRASDIPVIFMTAHTDTELMEKAKYSKPYGYVIKPFQAAQIRSAIEIALTQKKTVKALKASQAKIRSLSAHMLETQEQERKRISMALHDQLGQALSLLRVRIDAVCRKLPETLPDQQKECREISAYVKQIIEDTRRLSWELSPRILEDLGLSAGLKWLIEEAGKHLRVKTELHIQEIDHLFPAETRIRVFRIFQEAVSNIIKYAQAGRITVVARKTGDMVQFSIKDDGKGFAATHILALDSTEKGLGLATMEEWVNMLGGEFDVVSRKGEGTEIRFSVPTQ